MSMEEVLNKLKRLKLHQCRALFEIWEILWLFLITMRVSNRQNIMNF